MPVSLFGRNALVWGFLAVAAPAVVLGQTSYLRNGVEYPIAGSLPGDQAQPQLGLSGTGGYLVWQDNITDGDGMGISALRLDSSFSGSLSPFRVNSIGPAEQENPQVSLLNGGGAVFVWQGGKQGFQRIYARFLSPTNLWLGGDVRVNTFTNNAQVNPVVTILANSNVVVAWASFNQAAPTSLRDVYAQVLSPAGQKVGGEFQVNQFISYNQRDPAIAALSDGRFVVAWVSEQQRNLDASTNTAAAFGAASVDVYARLFAANGTPVGNEFLVNSSANICSSPHVAAGSGGRFMVAWAERGRAADTNGWDIWGSTFSSAGIGSAARCINTTRYGDQYLPSISWDGMDYLVAWTGLAQDGSREGVFAQFLHDDGSPDQAEFQVNTTWINQQMQPTVASDGQGRFLAAWTSFGGGAYGFDLYAQRYVNVSQPLPSMSAPFVHVPFAVINGVYQPQIRVSWPLQAGLSVDHYDVYANGALAATLTTNIWLMTAANGLSANSTSSFQVDYVTSSGRRSPLSPATEGTTWDNHSSQIYKGALPVEWMSRYWAYGTTWPGPNDYVASGGPTVLQAFLTGADPTNPATWLRTDINPTAQGYFLTWNPQPGLTYQVQSSTNLADWQDLGSPRFAVGTTDSLYIGLSNAGYYRVMWLH